MMSDSENLRPDPDSLLQALKKEEEKGKKAKLKIFFGMCAGVGKTYDMLKAAHQAKSKGIDVVIGIIETHKRAETEALVEGLPVIPRKKSQYKGTVLEELDLDAVLARKPQLVLVDELAHTNVPGSRHLKRFQDVLEILDTGIDVYTTLNVQHLESHADSVAQITGSIVRETVPDSVFAQADEVEIIDIPPDELLKRLKEGKVYLPDQSRQAIENFFRKGNLTALREMALRLTAERVDHQLRDYMQSQRISGPWKSAQRILVGISFSPQSATLIRWARRMAYTMNASLLAVYVEISRPLTDREKTQLGNNMKLARDLGAEIVTTSDEDIAQALVRVARVENATQILIGKPLRAFSFRKSLLDQVIERSGDLDVYVVGGTEGISKGSRRFRIPEIRIQPLQYFSAAAAVCVVALICFPLLSVLGYQTVSLILLLTIALLPLKLNAGPVLLAAALSAIIWDFFFIPPRFTMLIGSGQDILMVIAYFAIATVTGTLTARIRAREKAVRRREEHAVALYSLTKDLTVASGQDNVARVAVMNLKKFFGTEIAIFLSEIDGDIFKQAHASSTYPVDEKEFTIPAWVYWNEKKAGKFTDTLPYAQATYYPMSGPRYPLGVIGIKPVKNQPLGTDEETLLQNFISQIASTLEREQLNELAKKSIVYVESERLYNTLFNSISHELRTPVAAIISATESLRRRETPDSRDVQGALVSEISTAAERLNRLIDNLLDMTRLESSKISPKLDWCDMHDLLNASVKKLERELSSHSLTIDIDTEMPLVKLDFTLIEQALTNLLHNAAIYTPPGSEITVRVFHEDEKCIVIVADNGPGFPREALPRVFEKFYRVPGTQAGGTGLGLSITKGFVEAHQGTITAENRPGGGAQFTISLPIQPPLKGNSHQ